MPVNYLDDMIKAVKNLGVDVTRDFSDEVWSTGVPEKNGWRKMDYDTTVIAAKLPEQKEISAKRNVETVEVPKMPEVTADVETEKVPEVVTPVAPKVETPAKRGPKKKINA